MFNKINLALNIVLLAAVAYLFFRTEPMLSTGDEPEDEVAEQVKKDTTDQDVSTFGSNARIVYVDAAALNEDYEFISEKYEELEKEQMRIESQIDRKMRAAEDRYRELEAEAATMTPSQMEQAQLELQGLQEDITQFQEKAASDFRNKEAKTQEQFFNNISDFLEKFNNDGRYDYILTYQIGGQVLFAKDSLDITEEVVRGLNEEHRASKQQPAQ